MYTQTLCEKSLEVVEVYDKEKRKRTLACRACMTAQNAV